MGKLKREDESLRSALVDLEMRLLSSLVLPMAIIKVRVETSLKSLSFRIQKPNGKNVSIKTMSPKPFPVHMLYWYLVESGRNWNPYTR